MPTSDSYTITDIYYAMTDIETAGLTPFYSTLISEVDEPASVPSFPFIFRLPPVIAFSDYTALGTDPITNKRTQKKTFIWDVDVVMLVGHTNINESGPLSGIALEYIKRYYAIYITDNGIRLNGTVDRNNVVSASPGGYTIGATEYSAIQFHHQLRQYLTFANN